jgi:hypothetical protein
MAAQATFGLALRTAIFLVPSPHIVGFDAITRLPASDLIVGITVAVLAMCLGSALDRTHGMTWTLPVFGLWIVSPWIFVASAAAGMIWTHVVCGLPGRRSVVVVVGARHVDVDCGEGARGRVPLARVVDIRYPADRKWLGVVTGQPVDYDVVALGLQVIDDRLGRPVVVHRIRGRGCTAEQ